MIALAVLLAAVPAAAGTHLTPGPAVAPPPPVTTVARPAHDSPGSPLPPAAVAFVGAGGAVLAAGTALSKRRDLMRDVPAPGAALGLEPPDDALVVFVPGHGNGPEVFDDLIDNMGLESDQVRYFDYRLATGDAGVEDASRRARVGDAATALNAYVAGLAEEGGPIHIIGFSKGGATTAEMLARWDDGGPGPVGAVDRAFLLDPPLASGGHGLVQSLGTLIDGVPDDGGYDPVDCLFANLFCEDDRDHLGRDAGVETVVIRNPASPVTSFNDLPEGLRVYDAPDGDPSVWSLWWQPWKVPGRIVDAHTNVVSNPDVADCIVAEMNTPGSCELPRTRTNPIGRALGRVFDPLGPLKVLWPF